ncbi:kelch-like protein 12 [Clavelina lepadiformis]|uniref:kelch-like protein 12 n=1 Tax=Clavelina lepadiformis TaxID=159417 RepID=UPI0040429777
MESPLSQSSNEENYEKVFESCHSSAVLKNLNRDRNNLKEFCDVTICIDSHEWPVHRCVIAVVSHFFRKMLTTEMKEKQQGKINIQTIEIQTMDSIIDFIYTCKITVTMSNVLQLLYAAEFMQVPFIKKYCESFLKDNLSPANSLSIMVYSERYDMKELAQAARLVITENFDVVVAEEEFKELSLEDVIKLLKTSNKKCASEDVICAAVLDWVKHDLLTREKHLDQLFALVKIEKLSRCYIKSLLANEELTKKNHKFVVTFCDSFLLRSKKRSVKRLKQDRKGGILIFGGDKCERKVIKYEIERKKWTEITDMNCDHFAASAVRYDDEVCVIGGKESESVEILSLKGENRWVEVADLNMRREAAASALCQGCVYVVGGKTPTEWSSASGQCYDFENNKWSNLTNMLWPRYGHALVCLQGLLYAIGGCNSDDQSAESYDPKSGRWSSLSPMNTPRYGLAAVVLNYEIYAIGGRTRTKDASNLSSVEKYNPYTDIWSEVASMNQPRRFHSACVVGSKIYVSGGNSKTLEVYDPLRDEWTIENELDELRDFSCAVAI